MNSRVGKEKLAKINPKSHSLMTMTLLVARRMMLTDKRRLRVVDFHCRKEETSMSGGEDEVYIFNSLGLFDSERGE